MFKLAKLGDLDKPLTPKILSNPQHNATKHILYLYSMESFIYSDMNRAIREQDKTKIQHYGAFAAALSYIIYHANMKRVGNQLKGTTNLFRGLKLKLTLVDIYIPGMKINLQGYTSTSKRLGCALDFALEGLKDDQVAVVFVIIFKGGKGLFELTEGFTAYPDEDEVLV